MSGAQIGGAVGAVVGMYFGNPQLGYMIGSAIGGAVDPEQIHGPRLTDAVNQTAQDGVPRPYGYGRYPTRGNIIWRDELKERKDKSSGKGSGTEQVTYRYTRSYAIAVSQGPISGFLIIKRNGLLVYDTRPDSELYALGFTTSEIREMRAAQAKFRNSFTLYYGDQTEPDPTMSAVKGAGNVPNYTGTAYIVVKDDDVTDLRGGIPQYEFVVAACGTRTDDFGSDGILLVTGEPVSGGAPRWAWATAATVPIWAGIPQANGANLVQSAPAAFFGSTFGVVSQNNARSATDPEDTWTVGATSANTTDKLMLAAGPAGWLVKRAGVLTDGRHIFRTPTLATAFSEVTHQYNSTLIRYTGGYYYIAWSYSLSRSTNMTDWETIYEEYDGNQIINFIDICSHAGVLYAIVDSVYQLEYRRVQIRSSVDGGVTWNHVILDMPPQTNTDRPLQLESNGTSLLAYCENGYVRVLGDGFANPVHSGLDGPGILDTSLAFSVPGRKIAASPERFFILGYGDDSNKTVSTEIGEEFSVASTLPINNAFTIVAGGHEQDPILRPIPDAPGWFINRLTGEMIGPSGTQIDRCRPTLASIVADQCNRRGVATIDVSELTDDVDGYRVASTSSPQKNIGGLMPGYFFDASEFDGVLHFPKRGRDPTFHLTMDDLVARDGDPLQWERTQEPELLRKITVGYLDPAATFTQTTQIWERRAGTVKAQGESTVELPIVGERDWAAQVADMTGKVAWAEPDTCTFHLSRAWAKLVTGAVGTITDDKGTRHTIRIEKIADDGGVRMIDARRTRKTAYQSTVNGAPIALPLFPGSNLRGPTDAVVMNLPVMLDIDDRPGIHWAAAGSLSGWSGARLQVQRAGEWMTLGDITSGCTMGALLSPLPFHGSDTDNTNTLHLRINGDLASVTYPNLLTERNALAIVLPDGTAEIVQFQTATLVGAGEYECTGLIRGSLDTVRSAHAIGARVVVLDDAVRFVDLPVSMIGQTLTFRAVSLGTDPDANESFDMPLMVMQAQREWAVANFEVVPDGDDFHLSWIPRHRLGNDTHPIRSANWDGYLVEWRYSGTVHAEVTTVENITFTIPGASDIDFTVTQLNRLTDGGTPSTVNIP